MDTPGKDIKNPPAPLVKAILLFWAVTATLMALLSTCLAVVLFIRAQHGFLGMPDRAFAGNYRWTEAQQESFLTLDPDHTFTQGGGPKYPFHRWEVARDGALLIVWQSGISRFTSIVSPGVYEGVNWNNTPLRMEKVD